MESNEKDKAPPAWTRDYKLNEECSAHGSSLCWKFASEDGCGQCFLNMSKSKHDQEKACEHWEKTMRMLPRDIDELADSKVCLFCADEDPEPADGYAVFDMANSEPYTEKGMIFGYGKKVRVPVGSLVSLEVAIGKKCRKILRTYNMIQVWSLIAFVAIGLILMSIPAIAQPMTNLFVMLPVIVLALMAVGGWYFGRNLSLLYRKQHSNEVNFDLSRIHVIQELLDRDWFYFQAEHGLPHMTFAKKRRHKQLMPPLMQEEAEEAAASGEAQITQ